MKNDHYIIPIDGEWSLEDLYMFPRAFEQCYFMYLGLLPDAPGADEDRIARAYEAFPWQGGYSAVGFYNQLKWAVPKRKRPRIIRIEYSSPGVIELGLIAVVVVQNIEQIVRSLCKSAKIVSATYTKIHRDLQKRKLLKIKTDKEIRQLNASERRAIKAHVKTMAKTLNVNSKALTAKTGSPFKSLKILLSLYRRMRRLAEFQKNGKIDL